MAQMTTSTMPTTQDGTPKAVWNVEPMELDWTMQPMKPRARVMATAKETSQELAESALEGGGDVVHRSAVNIALLVYLAGLDGQSGLGVDGGHAEKGDDPHPEDGPRSAGEDGSGGAHDIAGAHLGGNGGGQGLEGAHPAGLLPAPEAQVAEYLPHPLAEAAHLNEAGADAVKQAHGDEQEDQDVAGQVVVDVYNDGIERGF